MGFFKRKCASNDARVGWFVILSDSPDKWCVMGVSRRQLLIHKEAGSRSDAEWVSKILPMEVWGPGVPATSLDSRYKYKYRV